VERYYIADAGRGVCLHALSSMLTLLTPFIKGVSAKILGIGKEDDEYCYSVASSPKRVAIAASIPLAPPYTDLRLNMFTHYH